MDYEVELVYDAQEYVVTADIYGPGGYTLVQDRAGEWFVEVDYQPEFVNIVVEKYNDNDELETVYGPPRDLIKAAIHVMQEIYWDRISYES